jgi:spore coat protein U-like protein
MQMRNQIITVLGMASATLFSSPASAATTTATTSAKINKPVSMTKIRDLDFGTLAYNSFTGSRTITLTRGGTYTCAANIVCNGSPQTARFNIQGTDKLVALISVTSTSLSNGTDTIAFTPDAPLFVILVGSGAPGINFDIGGTITVSATLVGGTYSGSMNVTADYF